MNDHLLWRYATKKFDPAQKIPKPELQQILSALQLSPSSCGLQPWKFIVVQDPQLRKELQPHAHQQPQVTDADTLIILCAIKDMDEAYVKHYIDRIAQVRQVSVESLGSYERMMIGVIKSKSTPQELSQWIHQQVYIALGMVLNECAHLKIDACPMEGFDHEEFDEILELSKQGLESVVLCAVGYRATDDRYAEAAKVRFEENQLFIQR